MKIPHEGGWTFNNSDIAKGFDTHVREQLPWYDLSTGVVAHVIRHYLPENGLMYDIGASTGNISKSVANILQERNAHCISIEPSKNMIDLFNGYGEIVQTVAEVHDYKKFDVAVLFLAIMFVPVAHRESLLAKLIKNCRIGGCIIIFDKCEPKGGYIGTVLSRLTLAGKVATGTPANEIVAKELSLSGCQRPYTLDIKEATEVFRFGDFAGWVIEK